MIMPQGKNEVLGQYSLSVSLCPPHTSNQWRRPASWVRRQNFVKHLVPPSSGYNTRTLVTVYQTTRRHTTPIDRSIKAPALYFGPPGDRLTWQSLIGILQEPPTKHRHDVLNQAKTASFYIPSTSLFTDDPTMPHFTVWVTALVCLQCRPQCAVCLHEHLPASYIKNPSAMGSSSSNPSVIKHLSMG